MVNKQNVCFWALENPYVIHEKVRHAPRVTVWDTGNTSHGIIGHFFFEQTVNSECYFNMLVHSSFVPELIAKRLDNQWFMQDEATPNTANVFIDYLHKIFSKNVLSKI